ncbi:MAG: FAD-dependent oxidoreductase [bacterium]
MDSDHMMPKNLCRQSLPGKSQSLWISTTMQTGYPALEGSRAADVAILGAGMAGLTAAVLLKQAGLKVAVIEADRVASGVSGHTTAKITSAHTLIYDYLISHFGKERAQLYADANQAAIEHIAATIKEKNISCDFSRTFACTYTEDERNLDKIQAEVKAAKRLGLPAAYADTLPLPFRIQGAICFTNQAQFHPRKYLLALAASIPGNGSYVFEASRAISLRKNGLYHIKTSQGEVTAGSVIVATHFPFLNRGLYFARMYPRRAYLMAMHVQGDRILEGMYISEGEPYHTIRSYISESGEKFLLVGGEHHKTGQGEDTSLHYQRVEQYAKERFEVESIDYRWSTQDNIPIDRVPFIGTFTLLSRQLYVATGFGGWGMTLGTVAGMILSDLILERHNPWISLFDPSRLPPFTSAKRFISQNLDTAREFTTGHLLHPPEKRSFADLTEGEGAIVQVDAERIAAYKDDQGQVHAFSANCTHLGCVVNWNSAEKSWDCPCHGSRFDYDGKVIHAPAIKDLAKKQ